MTILLYSLLFYHDTPGGHDCKDNNFRFYDCKIIGRWRWSVSEHMLGLAADLTKSLSTQSYMQFSILLRLICYNTYSMYCDPNRRLQIFPTMRAGSRAKVAEHVLGGGEAFLPGCQINHRATQRHVGGGSGGQADVRVRGSRWRGQPALARTLQNG